MPTIILASLIAGAATAHTASTADEPPAAEAVEVVTSCTPPERPASSDYRVAKNLTYRTWPAKKLDIARPATPGSYPVVILLHGGAWIAGTKLTMRAEIERLAVRGFVGVAVSYRLVRGDDSRFPTQLHDVRCALRWLRANAAEYDIDPERAVVLGMSAGGHLGLRD